MVATLQITRTGTDNNSPVSGSLKPGQLAVEMGTPTRLWVGVPAANNASLQKMLLPTTGGGAVGDAAPATPIQGDLWWDSTATQMFVSYHDGNSQQWVQANSV